MGLSPDIFFQPRVGDVQYGRAMSSRHRVRRSALAGAAALVCALACRAGEAPGASRDRADPPRDLAASQPADASPSLAAISDDPVIQRVLELAAADSQVDDHLLHLSDEIGPRLTGSAQLVAAELWAVERLRSWGLRVERERWGELAVGFERGPSRGAMIRPQRRELEFVTYAWTAGTHADAGADGLTFGGPVRGQALRYPDDAAQLRALRPYLRGAWIVMAHGQRYADSPLDRQIERAFERGGIAGRVLPSGAPDDLRMTVQGNVDVRPEALPERVVVRVRGDHHAEIVELLAAGEFVELEFAVANRFVSGPIEQFNVIAELEGERWPEQRVIVAAHLDSWDGGTGAIDNGTGVATTLEAARLLARACAETGERPDRTLSFMLFSGEEQGLLGSKAWVEAHRELLPGISAVLVHDGGTNYLSGLGVTPEQHAIMAETVAPAVRFAGDARAFSLRLVEGLPWASSDSDSFLAAGVPAFFWEQRGRSDYSRYHHTQLDRSDAVIDEYQRHSAQVVAMVAWGLAEAEDLLPRDNISPLRPRRLGVSLPGMTVDRVFEGPAEAAGVRVGDRIVSVDGEPVASIDALVAAIQRGPARKQLGVVRADDSGAGETTLELSIDWSADPREQERQRRRQQRRESLGPELRPWDRAPADPDGAEAHD